MSKITINSNGSKWLGQSPDSIKVLLSILNAEDKEHDLDIAMFGCHGFVTFGSKNGYSDRDYREHNVRIQGNFKSVSHVFDIEGVYKDLEPVIKAIEGNLSRIADRANKQ